MMSFLLWQILPILFVVVHGQLRTHSMSSTSIDSLKSLLKECRQTLSLNTLTILSEDHLSDTEELYQLVFEELQLSVQNFRTHNILESAGSPSCVLLLFKVRQMKNFLKNCQGLPWKHESVYILHCIDEISSRRGRSPRAILQHHFGDPLEHLWRTRGLHKVIVSAKGKYVFYDPFEVGNNSNSVYNQGKLKITNESAKIFEARDIFNGYKLKISLFDYLTMTKIDDNKYDGADGKTMNEVCRMMNVQSEYHETKDLFGWAVNGTFTGTLKNLVYRYADVTFNGFFIKDYETRDIEFTKYLTSDSICVIVPKRAMVPAYLVIVRVFKVDTWILIFAANLAISIVYAGIKSMYGKREALDRGSRSLRSLRILEVSSRIERKRITRERLSRIFRIGLRGLRTILRVLVGCIRPLERSKEDRLCERIVLGLSLSLGIVLNGSFTSQLASSFSKPTDPRNIDTLKELDDSGLQVLTNFPDLLVDVFIDNETPIMSNLRSKLRRSNLSEMSLIDNNFVCLIRKNRLLLRDFQADKIHQVKECPRSYLLAFVVPKGSPFLKRINAIIERLQNSGIYEKWIDDMKATSKLDDIVKPVVIKLHHLDVPFNILFVGLAISLITFLCEYKGHS